MSIQDLRPSFNDFVRPDKLGFEKAHIFYMVGLANFSALN